MGRLMAIDYGRKRCGIAVTDPLRLIATGLETVATAELGAYVKAYVERETVDALIVGLPRDLCGNDSESMRYIRPGVVALQRQIPNVPVIFFDERFTSAIAHQAMLNGGMKKQQRRDKSTVDRIAASIILNDFIQSKQYKDSGI